MVLGANHGKSQAVKTKSALSTISTKDKITFNEEKHPDLFLLKCGTYRCAGVDLDKKTIHYFDINDSYSFKISKDTFKL